MESIFLSPISLENLGELIQKNVLVAMSAVKPETTPTPETSERFKIQELADYLKVTKSTIHAYKKRGVFPYYQTGRTVYFKKSEVDAALEVGKKKGAKA